MQRIFQIAELVLIRNVLGQDIARQRHIVKGTSEF